MTGSLAQIINGVFLLLTFFCFRLVFGFYMSYRTYGEFIICKDLGSGMADIVWRKLNIFLQSNRKLYSRRLSGDWSRANLK